MQVSYQNCPVEIYWSVISVFRHFYNVKCQTWFVQLPLFIMAPGARSMWCGSVRRVGFVSKHQFCRGMDPSPYVPDSLCLSRDAG